MSSIAPEQSRIGIVGLGYVGLSLAAAMARKGFVVYGADSSPDVVYTLSQGRSHLYEPGVNDILAEEVGKRIFIGAQLPKDGVDVAIICVSTPVGDDHEPVLENLASAAEEVAGRCAPGTLVVVRSTVPVGACRSVVLPPLMAAWGSARLVMAPERTIQGRAMEELASLPQVVGGVDEESLAAGLALFEPMGNRLLPVSSLETAEFVKLANNCHMDVMYSFGNELALLTDRLGLDPLEVLHATNTDYPRQDLAKPGYVGGGCLSKDPYIMMSSARGVGRSLGLIGAARALNEELPEHVGDRIVDLMREAEVKTLLVLGWAYKGTPPTDDIRGTPIEVMASAFSSAGLRVLGHDPLVRPDVVRSLGGEPVTLVSGFAQADAVLVITDHPEYRSLDVAALLAGSDVRLVYDSWRVLDGQEILARGIRYYGLGYAAPVPAPVVAEVSA
ncbi:nucleotide sugar dehydrogenase [Actinokineospora guangxiensis]|uniref:Nucleotide sugar dehydrogenase n=1 Tax=Actinokineospora guangxiensis TaxID=1490288 RepID=A0ABW0ETC8_9PSEU